MTESQREYFLSKMSRSVAKCREVWDEQAETGFRTGLDALASMVARCERAERYREALERTRNFCREREHIIYCAQIADNLAAVLEVEAPPEPPLAARQDAFLAAADEYAATLARTGGDHSRGKDESEGVQADVAAFHRALDIPVGDSPAIRRPELRATLIEEEAAETCAAIRDGDLVGAIDGMCDVLCVIYGAAVEFGIELAPFWAEVHRTNMAKVGGPVREDGKRLKPEGWSPPDIAGILARTAGGSTALSEPPPSDDSDGRAGLPLSEAQPSDGSGGSLSADAEALTIAVDALDWIEAEPEDPLKVQARARAALAALREERHERRTEDDAFYRMLVESETYDEFESKAIEATSGDERDVRRSGDKP